MAHIIEKSKSESSVFQSRIQQRDTFDPSSLTPSFPRNALVELSNWCNHACIFCTNPRMNRGKGFLDIDLFRKFLNEAVPAGLRELGLYTTGEPFFVKNLPDFVRVAKESGIEYVYITTNGALATIDRVTPVIDAGLSSLKFSFNAGSREKYKLVHGKDDFDKVLSNIRNIWTYKTENKLPLRMLASCIVTKFIEDEIEKVKALLLPYVEEIVFVGVGNQGGQSVEQSLQLASYLSDKPLPRGQKASPCAMLWTRLHLTFEGYLTLCCVDYENALTYADVRNTSVKDAWNNIQIQEMRRRHQSQNLQGTLCRNCLYGTNEKVFPITALGNKGLEHEISSNQKSGEESVSRRIETLSD